MNETNTTNTPSIPPQRDEDEISLVDLLAVLIRFRRMILGGTLLVLVVAVGWLYGLPAAGFTGETVPPTYTATIDLETRSIPEALEPYITVDPVVRAQTLLGDTGVTGEELTVSFNRSTGVITAGYNATTEEEARSVLTTAVREANALLADRLEQDLEEAEQRITRRVEIIGDRLGTILEDAPGTTATAFTPDQILRYLTLSITMENAVQTFREDADLLEQIRHLRERTPILQPVVAEPRITREVPGGTGRAVRVVVSTVAALFLLIFVAFVRQYIRTVAADEEESRKLREAWKGR